MTNGAALPFVKMHGLGKDFVIFDGRPSRFIPTQKFLQAVANRRRGVGCDQVIVLCPARAPEADLHMAIYNADGSQVGACGNATRCVASLLFAELQRKNCVIETIAGILHAWEDTTSLIAVDFGEPRLDWTEIPLAKQADTLNVPVSCGVLSTPCCVNMGNPHAVFFVPDVDAVALAEVGSKLEVDAVFPEHCNIEIAQILSNESIRMRVWERGSGITEACGSDACATLVAAVRKNLSARRAKIVLDGGEMVIEWRDDNHVIMIGAASFSYRGILPADFGA